MARVNVEQKALSDPRFGILARLMGGDDPDLALGRMIRVWAECLDRETYVLPTWVIIAVFHGDKRAPSWLVKSQLAQRSDNGYYIRGTEGRIEWLQKKRATAKRNGALGGRPPKAETNEKPSTVSVETPPAPAPAPAPVLAPAPVKEEETPPPQPKKPRLVFIPPTVGEVADYVATREVKIDAQQFVDFYASKGWRVGDQPMKDWRAAVRTWERRDDARGSAFRGNGKPTAATPKQERADEIINEWKQKLQAQGHE